VPGSNGGPVAGVGILSGSLGAGLAGVSAAGGVGGGGGGGSGASANSRRSRGAGTRGRRRTKGPGGAVGAACDPSSPGMVIEPPSFESAAAAVGVVEDANAHLRNYRKYL